MTRSSTTILDSRAVSYFADCSPDDVLQARRKGIIEGIKRNKRHWVFTMEQARRLKTFLDGKRQAA